MTDYELVQRGFSPEDVDAFMATGREAIEEAAAEIRQRIAAGEDPRQIFMEEITSHSEVFTAVSKLDSDTAFMTVFTMIAMAAFVLAERTDQAQSTVKVHIDNDQTPGFTSDRDAPATPEA